MKKNIYFIYKKYFPQFLQNKISIYRNKGEKSTLRAVVLEYYKSIPESEINQELREALIYLQKNPIATFPYRFKEKYTHKKIKVYVDNVTKLKYVIHQGKPLYFKRSLTVESIIKMYRELLIEQDINSPHCYMSEEFSVNRGDVVIDCGAAEGIFSLSILDKVSRIYVIESDPEWIEALKMTFRNCEQKVIVINKYISNDDTTTSMKLDTYFEREKIDFIKIDVDGAERDLIKGSINLLKNYNNLKLALCVYHKIDDEIFFSEFFSKLNYQSIPSPGYMFFLGDNDQTPPYLRKGVLRINSNSA